MNETYTIDSFGKFLDKLKTNENSSLIESIYDGYLICFESNFCDKEPELCKDNMDIIRKEMPVIEPTPEDAKEQNIDNFLELLNKPKGEGLKTNDISEIPDIGEADEDYLTSSDESSDRIKFKHIKIPVSKLKATQNEIIYEKAKGMYDDSVKGDFIPWEEPIIVSKDYHILDGHHRWAATKLWNKNKNEDKKMNAYFIPIDMKRLLKIANAFTDAVGEIPRKDGDK